MMFIILHAYVAFFRIMASAFASTRAYSHSAELWGQWEPVTPNHNDSAECAAGMTASRSG